MLSHTGSFLITHPVLEGARVGPSLAVIGPGRRLSGTGKEQEEGG